MTEVNYIIDCLEKTPLILIHLLQQIPNNMYKLRRVEGKWSIHGQVCHLVDAQSILMHRFKQFEMKRNPLIKTYTPPAHGLKDPYLKLNMDEELNRFPELRHEMIQLLRGYDEGYWKSEGRHEVFTPYNTRLLLMHSLNVDYAHLFSIEQLGLTKPGMEGEIMTIP